MPAAPQHYEPVLEVTEYYDGPRAGVAHFGGRPHKFQSLFIDATEYKDDFESIDVFELIPVNQASVTTPILAHAVFRTVSAAIAPAATQGGQLEVYWQVIERP